MDTDSEIRRDEYYRDHLGMCGTCRYNKRKYCGCCASPLYDEKITDKDGCKWWVERGKYVG